MTYETTLPRPISPGSTFITDSLGFILFVNNIELEVVDGALVVHCTAVSNNLLLHELETGVALN